jgi:DNA uptake protein ComE-like DNA-binding protein
MLLKELFYLRKSDRHVIIVLMMLIVIVSCFLFFVGGSYKKTGLADNDSSSRDSFWRKDYHHKYDGGRHDYYAVEGQAIELSQFDPNTADSTQLLKLGLAPWQVRSIYRYRAKGGIFRTADDFSHIYGLTKGQYDQLKPYIYISEEFRPLSAGRHTDYNRDSVKYPVKIKPTVRIVLNEADTNQLKTVPGIGSGYARAIINYGNRLGGYCYCRIKKSPYLCTRNQNDGAIAQLVEQRTENPCVPGSIPGGTT